MPKGRDGGRGREMPKEKGASGAAPSRHFWQGDLKALARTSDARQTTSVTPPPTFVFFAFFAAKKRSSLRPLRLLCEFCVKKTAATSAALPLSPKTSLRLCARHETVVPLLSPVSRQRPRVRRPERLPGSAFAPTRTPDGVGPRACTGRRRAINPV